MVDMNTQKKVEVTISNRTVLRVIAIVLLTLLAVKFFNNIAQPLTLIFTSFFLAIALNPAVSMISKHLKIKSRAFAVGIAYTTVLVILIAFISAIVPQLFSQTRDFIETLPNTISSLNDQSSGLGKFVAKYDLEDTVDSVSKDLAGRIKTLPAPVLSTASKIGSGIVSFVAILFMTFMMLVEGPGWKKELVKQFPDKKREYYNELILKMYGVVTNYVNGQILIALIAATFALFGLLISSTILGVSTNAIGLAGIIAITGLIPMIGNTLGAIIVVSISLLTSIPLAIIMAVFFLVYQQIENVTIQPFIQSKKSELTPLLVFIAAILGIGFGGLMGAFIAIPFAGCIRILLIEYHKHKIKIV